MKDEKTHIKITKRRICCSCSLRVFLRPRRTEKRRTNYEKKPLKLGKRCDDKKMKNQFEITEPPTKSKFRNPGGGRKVTAPEVRPCTTGSST